MKSLGVGTARLARCLVGRMGFLVAASTLAIVNSCCIGPADTIRPYIHKVEIEVADLDGGPAAGVKVYHYDWPISGKYSDGQQIFDSAQDEAVLQRRRPELLLGVNHQTDASGRAVIPVFDAEIVSVFPLIGPVPNKLDKKGSTGKVCIIGVDDGVNADRISVRLEPGHSARGCHYQIRICTLSEPQQYTLP